MTGRTLQGSSGTLLQLALSYGASGQNNGNVTSQQIQTSGGTFVGGTNAPALNLTQYYCYDAYDRITQFNELPTPSSQPSVPCPTPTLSQTFTFDQFGNLAVTGGYIPNPNYTLSDRS